MIRIRRSEQHIWWAAKRDKTAKAEEKDAQLGKSGRLGLVFGLTAGVAFQGVNWAGNKITGDSGKTQEVKQAPQLIQRSFHSLPVR